MLQHEHGHNVAEQAAPLASETPEQKQEAAKVIAIAAVMKERINVKSGKDIIVLDPIGAVYRNNTAVPFYETDISRARGDKQGLSYPAPHLAWIKEHSSEFLTWLGSSIALRWTASKLKTVLQALHEEACDDLVVNGEIIRYKAAKNAKPGTLGDPKPDYEKFDTKLFYELAEELSPRSETLAEINENIMSLAGEMADMDFDSFTNKYGMQQGILEFKAAQQSIKLQIQSYNIAKDKKKRHKSEELQVDEDPSVPANAPA